MSGHRHCLRRIVESGNKLKSRLEFNIGVGVPGRQQPLGEDTGPGTRLRFYSQSKFWTVVVPWFRDLRFTETALAKARTHIPILESGALERFRPVLRWLARAAQRPVSSACFIGRFLPTIFTGGERPVTKVTSGPMASFMHQWFEEVGKSPWTRVYACVHGDVTGPS